jgi:hypothetical protein
MLFNTDLTKECNITWRCLWFRRRLIDSLIVMINTLVMCAIWRLKAGLDIQFHSFLILTLDLEDWSTVDSGRLIPVKGISSFKWKAVCPKASLKFLKKKDTLFCKWTCEVSLQIFEELLPPPNKEDNGSNIVLRCTADLAMKTGNEMRLFVLRLYRRN